MGDAGSWGGAKLWGHLLNFCLQIELLSPLLLFRKLN